MIYCLLLHPLFGVSCLVFFCWGAVLFYNHLAEEEYGMGLTPIFYVSNLVFFVCLLYLPFYLVNYVMISYALSYNNNLDQRMYAKDLQMGLDARKPVFGGLRATKAQTSLRIRAV